jgi:hypothetical protein
VFAGWNQSGAAPLESRTGDAGEEKEGRLVFSCLSHDDTSWLRDRLLSKSDKESTIVRANSDVTTETAAAAAGARVTPTDSKLRIEPK